MTTFLLKTNCEEYFHGAEPRPTKASQWENAVVTVPQARLLQGGPGADVKISDDLIIWTHDHADYGKGLGLTAVAKVGAVEDGGEHFELRLVDVELVRPHVQLSELNEATTGSQLLDFLRSHRLRRTIEVTDAQVSDFWRAIDRIRQHRQALIDSYSSPAKTEADKALEADSNRIAEGFEKRFHIAEGRPEQAAFRASLLKLYGGRCAITRTSVGAVLQAAHVVPFSDAVSFRNDVSNGLLLRADIHALFDKALISLDPQTSSVVIAKPLKGTLYEKLDGKNIKHFVRPEFVGRHNHEFNDRNR